MINEWGTATVTDHGNVWRRSISTCSEPILQLASSWYNECISSHTECSCRYDGSFRPTRLMSIIDEAKSGKRIANLEETGQSEVPKPYVALSYCWGGKSQIKLLLSNYQEFLTKGLGTEKLPLTMKVFSRFETLSLPSRVKFSKLRVLFRDRSRELPYSTHSITTL